MIGWKNEAFGKYTLLTRLTRNIRKHYRITRDGNFINQFRTRRAALDEIKRLTHGTALKKTENG